ncbi:NmrA family NAD(P)-binding protein [Haladaptatus sp. NG-WS-4]
MESESDVTDEEGRDRILVVGATGTVGSPLVARLLDAPVSVRIATRSPASARRRFGDEAEYVAFDLAHPETWGRVLEHVDRMFLLFPPGVGVDPVRSFLSAAERVGLDHVTYLSILGAEKLPVLPHRRIETHLERTGMAYTFLRASYFMQNLSEVHRPEVVERDELFVPAGGGTLSFVDARDVAAVAAAVLTEPAHENRAYDLTGPAALDFDTVADVFTDVLGRPITYADPSRLAFARHIYRRGVPASLVAFMTVEYSVVRLGRSGRTTDDVEVVLGRAPRTMREFVRDYADAFRSDSGLSD